MITYVSKKTPGDKVNRLIRERIRDARTERGMSEEDLVRHLFKSRVAVSDMERGRVEVGAADLVFIANVLEKPFSYFVPYSPLGASHSDLSPSEKELVYWFRQLGRATLENVAMSQLKTLAQSAIDQDEKEELEGIKKDAAARGLEWREEMGRQIKFP